jgi:hypothetical protein
MVDFGLQKDYFSAIQNQPSLIRIVLIKYKRYIMQKTNCFILMLNVAAATATFAQDTPKELVYTIRGKFEGLGNGKVIWYYIDKNLPQVYLQILPKQKTIHLKSEVN